MEMVTYVVGFTAIMPALEVLYNLLMSNKEHSFLSHLMGDLRATCNRC